VTAALAGRLCAARNLKVLSRSPVTVVQSVAFPTLLLLVLLAAFGRTIGGSIDAYADRLVPQLVVAAGAFGAAGTGIAIHTDRQAGMVERLRSLPLPRWSYLAGTVTADALRALTAAVLLSAIGHVFGFRFERGLPAAVGFLALAVAFSTIWGWLAVRVGLTASQPEAVGSLMNGPILLLFFLSVGFVPAEGFPGYLQPVVRANPLSCAVSAMIGLSSSGPILVPVLQTLAWTVGLGGVLAWSAIRRFRSS
jgi:ABC transporter DrrB family efflux protein